MSKRKSDLWNYFEIVGKTTASCNMCKRLLSFKTSITNLKKHIEKKHVLVLDPLLPSDKSASINKKDIYRDEEFMEAPEANSQDKELPTTEDPVSYIWNLESIAERQNVKKQHLYKRQNMESLLNEAEIVGMNINSEITSGLQSISKSLQEFTGANAAANSVNEQQLSVEKRRNVIFRKCLTVLKNISEKINVGHSTTLAGLAKSSTQSYATTVKRKLEIYEDGTVAFKHSRTEDPAANENRLRDIRKEEKRIEIEERRLKLEERKVMMEGQIEERKIEIDERKLKLEEQKAILENQSEERKLEIDEMQMKLVEQKFMLEVQIEERKLEIDEKRLRLEERKALLEEEKESYNETEIKHQLN